MYQYKFHSMSTIVQISINQELFANDLLPIYKLFELIEETCSRFRPDSELSRLNTQVGKEVAVSSELLLILHDAARFYKETDGIFNPGILAVLEQNGYRKSIEFIRDCEVKESLSLPFGAIQDQPFTLNEKQCSVTLYTTIDLGGIAKGWVIDRAASMLAKLGYGFINVGGDICIFGTLPRPLNIGIENPFDNTKIISSIQIEDGALATSTSMKRKWRVNGQWNHHLIDTRTGKPSNSSIVSATLTAPTALEADVWAKTILLQGKDKGREWISRNKKRAVLIEQDGDIWRGGE
ncbi:FAD:protein FMN transferase [Neobacillus mesonae]|uniref:FAD:protein FMN transferase n=1 Tax=Neobacillus mesonae TaxID=1193713 RepID=UPI00203F3E74|nr:FAD:protein FMN transferase [Neobacillus mesonae]MCM3569668.1 FAD:protein FMN transferase [Neobacillus mesonae]